MKKIDLEDGWAISTLNAETDGIVTITLSQYSIIKGMALMNATQLAELIRDLKEVYLSIADL